MTPAKRWTYAVAASWLLSSCAVFCGCGGPAAKKGRVESAKGVAASGRLQRPAPREADFAGSQACVECHEDIAKSYLQHPMAKSTQNVLDEPVEDYERAEFSPVAQRTYRVQRKDGVVRHHEIGLDGEGQVIYDQAVDIRFAIGSGRRGRSYVIDRDGLLFISPISWYSSAKRWDLSPQYKAVGSLRFERPAFERCLHCHAGGMVYESPPGSRLAVRYREPIFSEMAIGCERCHGPGEKHIALHRGAWPQSDQVQPRGEAAQQYIVNPSRLSAERRDAVCNQCHLHGEALVLRYGRTHADFRAGDHLGDVWSFFVAGAGVDDSNKTRAVSQGEQMLASACYQKSKGKLGCTSCHDPHQMPPAENKEAYFNARCSTCHQPSNCSLPAPERNKAPALGSCIACHMPALGANDVPHTTQTDHRIPRRARRAAAAEAPLQDPAKFAIFDIKACPLPPLEEARARGLLLGQLAEFRKDSELAREVEKLLAPVRAAAPDDVDVLDKMAVAASITGRKAEAAQLWRSAATIDPTRHEPLFSLAALAQSEGNLSLALTFEDRLLARNPWQSSLHIRHSRTLAGLGRFEEALRAAEKAAELDPSNAETFELLARLNRKLANDAKAEEGAAMAERLRAAPGALTGGEKEKPRQQ
jgi:hypothetical protein